IGEPVLAALAHFGLSSICNVVAAIKTAKRLGLGPRDAIVTVATDGAAMYASERPKAIRKHFGGTFDSARAADVLARHLLAADTEHVMVMGPVERARVFNLGYFTWVEQQGVSLADFEARRDQGFWRGLRELLRAWDAMIEEFNGRTGVK
ncbi:MAG: pyridoxal-5'-phosphate-dependent protein subunit beta, partial [Gemmatimonadales bacterium]